VGTSPIVADAALILVQKSRAATLATIHRAVAALNVGATVLVDGQKDTGIDTVLKTLTPDRQVVLVYQHHSRDGMNDVDINILRWLPH